MASDHKSSHTSGSARAPEPAPKAQPPEPPRHPAQPPPATPGVAQRDQQPQPESTEPQAPPEKPVAKEEASALFHAGHKLRKKGDPPEKWFAMARIGGQMCMLTPLDDATEKEALNQDLVLGD